MKRNNSADTQVSAGGGGGAGAEMPLQSLVKTMVKEGCPWVPVEQTFTCSPGGAHDKLPYGRSMLELEGPDERGSHPEQGRVWGILSLCREEQQNDA